MKKILFTLSVVLLAACAKEENTSINSDKTPAGELVEVTFTAEVPTKTSVSIDQTSGKATVTWDEGDEIAIHYWDGTAQASVNVVAEQVDGKSALFVAALPAGVTEFWAVSPASTAVSLAHDETTGYSFQLTVPGTTDGSFEQANIIAAKAVAQTDGTYYLAFKNVSSVLRFEKGESLPTSIAFRNVSGAKVYGQVNVSFNAEGLLETCAYASGGSGSAGLSNMVASEDGAYYIPLLPDVEMSDGFVIKMATKNNSDIPGALCDNENARTIARGQILDIGTFEDKIVYDYYFHNGDDGDMTQANPGSLAQAKTLTTVATIANNRLMDGVTLHFAAGTYSFSSPWEIKFSSDGIPNVKIVGDSKTIFDGGGASRIVDVSNASLLTFENITFQNGKSTAGAAVHMDNGVEVRFNQCRFLNNVVTTNGGGGAITVLNASTLFLNACYFGQGNKGPTTTPNAHVVYANGETVRLGINNTTFDSGTLNAYTQGSVITTKGYTVIVNSTIVTTVGKWGAFALGCHKNNKDTDGALIINSIIRNITSGGYPAIYSHDNYYLRSMYNILSDVEDNDGKSLKDVTDDANYFPTSCVYGITKTYPALTLSEPAYVWDGSLDTSSLTGTYTKATLSQIEQEIEKTSNVGTPFLAWLKTIKTANGKTALEVDIRGVGRDTEAMWPGAYQAE